MKKFPILCLILCLLLQCVSVPSLATQTDDSTEPPQTMIPDVAYGTASVGSGCRTIDGQNPLGGSQRMLDTAQAAFIYEISTQTVIYGYNPDLRLYPGSLSKMLTALIALEECELDEKVTVNTESISKLPVGTITAKLKNGEVITMEAALHWMILASANDAALVIAEHISGSEAAFVEKMNQRALELGCTDTHLTNCHGLDDSTQYTTARDIAKITLAGYQNEKFRQIFGAKNYSYGPTNRNKEKSKIDSGNHLIYELVLPQFNDRRVTGGMPSYVSEASGASIAFTAEDQKSGLSMVFVILGATRTFTPRGRADYYGNFNEALDLLEYSFSGYKINQILYEGQALNQFPVANGESNVVGQPMEPMTTVLPVNAHMKNLIFKYRAVDSGIYAPVEEGQKIATVQVWYGTSCITEAELYAMNPVRAVDNTGVEIQSAASRDDSNVSGILSILGTAMVVILVPLAIYLAYNNIRRYLARSRRRRRRASRRRSR